MDRQESIDKLNEVKAMKLPHMNYTKVKEYYGVLPGFEETEENIKLVDEYFNKFLDSKNEQFENGCWICGNKEVSIRWGIVHGVAYSNCCGLSYRVYHYPDDICKDKNLFNHAIRISLQYHPDSFEIDEED